MMKHLLLIAGAAALGFAAPAVAKPGHGNGNGHGHGYDRGDDDHGYRDQGYGYGGNDRGCPPGLAKKHNGCMPPGQARKLGRGDRWVSNYGNRYTYGQIPYNIRRQYDLSNRYNYYYNDGSLYQVDPRTNLVQQIISALIR